MIAAAIAVSSPLMAIRACEPGSIRHAGAGVWRGRCIAVVGARRRHLDRRGLATACCCRQLAVTSRSQRCRRSCALFPLLPWTIERALLLVAGLWLVNLVNFMDGIDWMTVAEVVPVTGGVALVGALGALPPQALIVALALNGAMLGFAPFNRPVARLFLGDVGSLPIGLLLFWLLLLVAGHRPPRRGAAAAALLSSPTPPSTLLRRRVSRRARLGGASHALLPARDATTA